MAQRGHNIDPTPTDIGAKEAAARNYLESQYRRERSNQISSLADVHVRDLNPGLDLQSGADNSSSVDDSRFEQTGLSAGLNEVYTVDSDQKAENAMIAITAVTLRGATNTIEIRFRTQPGGVFERLQVQGGFTDEEATVLLNSPVYFGLNDDGAIEQYAESAGDDTVVYHGYTAEKSGTELTSAEGNFVPTNRGGGGSSGGS